MPNMKPLCAMLKPVSIMWVAALDLNNCIRTSAMFKRHKPAQAAASVPDKDGTLCSSVQFRGECFLLVDPTSFE